MNQVLDDRQVVQVVAAAEILLAGAEVAPAPGSLPEYPALVGQAVRALGQEASALEQALDALPGNLTQASLTTFASREAASFELLSLVVVVAYFMSPTVRAAIGLPASQRRPAPLEQAADELGSGILDPVLGRRSPVKTLVDVHEASATDPTNSQRREAGEAK